ncbi:type 1 glutamine amidotransferase domain-containing protein [Thalassotalea aquiviva]|uniref:type 1 glutamine amidotransferase domain-containing protein n=1 Tax=Thalassotalea aquiviva TaxID=3242415 RepID=UPI00352A011E
MKKILMVLTSHDQLGNTGEKTGFWVEEFAAPYYQFLDANLDITLASPLGGQPPIDPKSELDDFQTPATKRFNQDPVVQDKLTNTLPLADLSASNFDAIFYPGGHGPLWDLVDNQASLKLIEAFHCNKKPIGVVCHATAVLLNAKDSHGNSLVENKKVTGFSNSEEAAVELTDVVPFLLEDELTARHAHYQKGDDWSEFVITDGHIISGQNPASSELAAKTLLSKLV